MTRVGDEVRHAAGSAVGHTRDAAEALDTALAAVLAGLPSPVTAAGQQARDALRVLAHVTLPVDEVQVLVEQLHAQRQSLQAVQAQMAALDHQLELLESALAPVEHWVGRLQDLRDAVVGEA